jgi:hypothetical protein
MLAPFALPTLFKSSEELPAGLIRIAMIVPAVPHHREEANLDHLLYPTIDSSTVDQKESGHGLLGRIASTSFAIEVVQKSSCNPLFRAGELVG